MSAPNIATLYDFESPFEDAIANYCTNINGNPFNQVLTPRTVSNANAGTDYLQTPRIMIRAGITGVGIQEEYANGSNYEAHMMGTLTLEVVTQRNDPAQNHGYLRGLARQVMLSASAVMNGNSVPYFQTTMVLPATSSQLINADNDEIMTQMLWQLEFFIPPASVPNS